MEHAEKPKRSEHDSRPFYIKVVFLTAVLWYSSLSVPSIIWLSPPLNGFTPLLSIACVLAPPIIVAAYLNRRGISCFHEVYVLLFGLAACAGVCWIIFNILFLNGGAGPCERRAFWTEVCVTFDADNAYGYTFFSPGFVPLLMIRTGYIGSDYEEHACFFLQQEKCQQG